VLKIHDVGGRKVWGKSFKQRKKGRGAGDPPLEYRTHPAPGAPESTLNKKSEKIGCSFLGEGLLGVKRREGA